MVSESKARKIGLFNLGNACYVNSVIQSLFMASDFRHAVLNLTEGNSQPLMTKLQSLFALLEHSQDAEKVAELTEGPHYLILTLLRFSFDPQTMKRRKILDNVSIPEVLKLPILVRSEETEDICQHRKDRSDLGSTFVSAVYDLCSVVVHSDISSESGHYYSYCRERTDTVPHTQPRDGTPELPSNKQLDFDIPWYLFNDHRVSTSSFESVSNLTALYPKATAYVLFYRQRADRPSSPLHEAVAEASRLHSQTFPQ